MIKKFGLIATSVLCLAFSQGMVSAQMQSFKPLYTQAVKQSYRQTYTDYNPYAENLRDKVVTNWSPKTVKRHRDAIVLVRVHKDGAIDSIKVQKSSNKKKFDDEITDSIRRSVPLDSLPSISQAEFKDVQLNFIYNKVKHEKTPQKIITANVSNLDGYEPYIDKVSDVVSKTLNNKSYFCKKDITLEMNLDKSGKLVSVKVKNASPKDNFINKEFDRETLSALHNVSYPTIPDKMGVNNITVDYRVLTQRDRLFRDFVLDYVLNVFRTETESFCVESAPNL